MQSQINPYITWQIVSAFITFGLGIYIYSKPVKKHGSDAFSLLMLGGTIWSLSNAIQWMSPDPAWQMRWNSVTYLGIMIVPTAWFLLAVKFTGYGREKIGKWEYLFWLVPILLFASLLTNPYHKLFFSSYEMHTYQGFVTLRNHYGILFYLHTIYSYVLLFLGLILIGYALITKPKSYGIQLSGLLIGVLAPFIGNIFYLFGVFPEGFPDPTPLAFTITGIAFAWAIFGGRMLEIIPLAHDTIVQNLSMGVLVMDSEKIVLSINPAAAEILGTTKRKFQGSGLSELLESNPTIIEPLVNAIDNLADQNKAIEIRMPETGRTFDVFVIPIEENGKRQTGWLVQFSDISQRLRAEANLASTQETFETILDTLQDAYFEADPSGIITYVNQAFIKATRYADKGDLIGKHFRHVVSRKYVRLFLDKFHELYKTTRPTDPFEFIYRTKDGKTFSSEIVVSPIIENGEAIGTRGIVRDISVRVEAEKILREAKDAAEHRAGELAAINRVATIVNRSLDLANILQSVCVEFTKIFPVRNTGIALLDTGRSHLEVVAFHAIDPEEESVLGLIMDIEGNLASQEVLKTQKTVVVENAQTDLRTKPLQEISKERGTRSFMIVPLLSRGQSIGTIGMPAKDPQYEFKENEIELAETIASQIATAIENASLYGQIETALGVAERDLEIGSEIQSGFFPDVLPEIPGWEISAYFEAARQVAGDFYDIFRFRNSNFTAFIIADVCDKGVGAALFMVLFRSLLRAFSETEIDQQNAPERLREIVLNTNNFIAEFHGQSNMFATLFFGILDPDQGILYYINGGHEPPVVMNKDGDIVQRLMPTGPAVGMFTDMVFTTEQFQLNQGDILVGFTDGATDAKNSSGDLFSEERLLKSIQAPWTSIFSMVFELYTGLRNHIGGQDQYDDITLISLRRKHNLDADYHAICRTATWNILGEMRDFVEAAAIETGLAPDDVFAFKLAAEEICTNIIRYGYQGQDPGYIAIAFEKRTEKAVLTFWDDGKYFSPYQADTPVLDANWETRETGGLGLYFVKELMDNVTYNKDENNINELILEKTLSTIKRVEE